MNNEIKKLLLKRELAIRKARKDFYSYCRLLAPEFYKKDRIYLKKLANTLQKLYEHKLKSNKLIIIMPPRHGKSRTLTLFCQWCLGIKQSNKIITCSYNNDTAMDFSRYTRDGISEEKTYPYETVFSDIFPNAKMSIDNASYGKWALQGQFFNYKGSGVGGGITGKGCDISIVDDPIKNAEIAFNELALDKIWQWYTGTFLSRLEENAIQIVNMTRWAKKDIVGRLLDSVRSKEWIVLYFPIIKNNKMLCPEITSKKSYEEKKETIDPAIFQANYFGKPIDIQGRLYKNLKQYETLPEIFDKIINYTDTADQGSDFLCSINAVIKGRDIYIINIYYTQDGMEITENRTAELLIQDKINISYIESNGGGRGFARNVQRRVNELKGKTVIEWFSNNKNKNSRILSNSFYVMENVYFPINWQYKFPDFFNAITQYQKVGKNKHDDVADALTGLAEKVIDGISQIEAIENIF